MTLWNFKPSKKGLFFRLSLVTKSFFPSASVTKLATVIGAFSKSNFTMISPLLVSIFALVGCNCQKKALEESKETSKNTAVKQYNLPKIEYVAYSRGFYEKIVIENKMVWISKDRDAKKMSEPVAINDDVNKELASYLKAVNLDQLATFKDPTQKRFYDGAAIAELKISVDGKEYQTTNFDHGYPPIEIEKLVNKITSFGLKQ